MIITLDMTELMLCRILATMRVASNRGAGVREVNKEYKDQLDRDMEGIIGEFVVAKQANLYPDFTILPRSCGYDLLSKTGKKIEVKATTYKNGQLIVKKHSIKDKNDYYFLVILNQTLTGGDIIGYATPVMVFKDENLKKVGLDENYVLTQEQLKKDHDRADSPPIPG